MLLTLVIALPVVAVQSQDASLPPAQASDLRFYASILSNPANEPETRRGAAERLLQMRLEAAERELDAALRRGDQTETLVVLEALAAQPAPVPGLLEALIAALATATDETLNQLALVLAKYEAPALVRVAAIAENEDLARGERLAAIHTLGAFPTRESGDRLIGLADPTHSDDPLIRAAALASLRRLAPADLGPDYAAWRVWWSGVRDKSPEEWSRELVRQYQDRTTTLERENSALTRRYVELLRRLYRSLAVDAQLARLPQDLEDELELVRVFALDRIERLLRDSVLIPEELRQILAARLDDPAPQMRHRAAELLDELDEPGLAEALVERLADEVDPEVVTSYLTVLGRRPIRAALPAALTAMGEPSLTAVAADCLWQLARAQPLTPDELASVHAVTHAAREKVTAARSKTDDTDDLVVRTEASLLRIAAYLGPENELAAMQDRLDDPDDSIRRAVAEGLAARGVMTPLEARSSDPAIYPVVLRVVAEQPADLASFTRLVHLRPDEATREEWAQTIRRTAGQLPPRDLIEADKLLASVEYADPTLRTLVLSPVVVSPPESLERDEHVALVARLAPLLIEQGDALRAHEIIEGLNGDREQPELAEVRFSAAVRAGRFDAAASASTDPARWMTELDAASAGAPEIARRMHEEITTRFGDALTDDQRVELEAIAARLAEPATGEATVEAEHLR